MFRRKYEHLHKLLCYVFDKDRGLYVSLSFAGIGAHVICFAQLFPNALQLRCRQILILFRKNDIILLFRIIK